MGRTEDLHQLDGLLAAGQISADDYLRRRDELLATAPASGPYMPVGDAAPALPVTRVPAPVGGSADEHDADRHDEDASPRYGRLGPWLAPLVLLLAIALGTAVWLASRSHSADSGGPKSAPRSTALASSMRPVVGDIPGTSTVDRYTGPATPAEAQSRGVVVPAEAGYLTACEAQSGATQVLVADTWSISASVFACSSHELAAAATAKMPDWLDARGLTQIDLGTPGVMSWYTESHPAEPTRPARLEIRYVSGVDVIGIVIQATTKSVALDAAEKVLDPGTINYPPSD